MRNHKLLAVILSLIYSFSNAQERLKVEYEVLPYYESNEKSPFEVTALSSIYELLVDQEESQYNFIEKIDNTQKEPGQGMSATMQVRSTGTLYKNTKNGTWTEDVLFENKTYLIKDSLKNLDWTITKEKRNIAGFDVLKATTTMDDKYKTEVTAWYAPKLNFKNGPDEFWGLPGLILEIETEIKHENGGREGKKIVAQKVAVVPSKIKAPSKGEVISKKDFGDMQEAHYKQMMEMFQSPGVDKD